MSFDILIIGAGLNGLVAAWSFAQAGFHVARVGPPAHPAAGRSVALLGRSCDDLKNLGLLAKIKQEGAPLRSLSIIDDTGSLFAPPPVTFRAAELGLDTFGWNIENAHLARLLTPGPAAVFPYPVTHFDFAGPVARLTLSDGNALSAPLVIGADGRGSPTRQAAGLSVSVRDQGQTALTALVTHTRPHQDMSLEFHTRGGPFTFVPLPGRRSSLVWLMRHEDAAALGSDLLPHIQRRSHYALGDIALEGEASLYPLSIQRVPRITAPRVALVGDAAHAFPPIGAQGLNLGLRDIACLVSLVSQARKEGADIGGEKVLKRYESQRRRDIDTRTLAVGLLNSALLNPYPPLNFLRGVGLGVLAACAPLRKSVMREGLTASSQTV